MASLERRSSRPIDSTSIPSIVTSDPGDGSTRRKSAVVRLDFPAPVLPTMPTRVRGSMSKDMPRITGASVFGYLLGVRQFSSAAKRAVENITRAPQNRAIFFPLEGRTLEHRTRENSTTQQKTNVNIFRLRADSLDGQVFHRERAIGGPLRHRAVALNDSGCLLRHVFRVLKDPLNLWF